ncbi:MAG TPA: hypothetical protein VNM66_08520, partial [Thermodesulfobacteriota bacterium]|nr:hypothetical protein [Thermodesulfobacteriota bacterium]
MSTRHAVGTPACVAFVHHANQYLITNGYENREGLDELIGAPGSATGYRHVLELHRLYRVPFNLHLSGTLLEALLWHRPDFVAAVRELVRAGLLELVGSSYGQNIMRFFGAEHNRRQLAETLRLYRDHLGVEPRQVKTFWLPERVWDTARLARVLTDPRLPNGGYTHVLVDDRLFYPVVPGPLGREAYDRAPARRREDFAPLRIRGGRGLVALPIALGLRQAIAAQDGQCLGMLEDLLGWLRSRGGGATVEAPIAIYADDLEKAAGVGGWDPAGPVRYESVLRWVRATPWVRAVRLGEWAARARPGGPRRLDIGTFVEMSRHFGAGEGYQHWYFDPQWAPYRAWYAWAEGRVRQLARRGADPDLIELAWKQLLASSWETAWHIPPCGVHGNPACGGEVSPWSRAIASHSRLAALIAEAASWAARPDRAARVETRDVDRDGDAELIVRNDRLFAVFAPRWGGRLVYLFCARGGRGALVVGNPCDDWNWMEQLHKYMEVPANHPGALADIGCEHDPYAVRIDAAAGEVAAVTLVNAAAASRAAGLRKHVRLAAGRDELEVTYALPPGVGPLTVECGVSPDYLRLLRTGRRPATRFRSPWVWEAALDGVRVWIALDAEGAARFEPGSRRTFGHGEAMRVVIAGRSAALRIGAAQAGR